MLVNRQEQEIIDKIKKTILNMVYGYYYHNFPEPKYKRDSDQSVYIFFKNDDYNIQFNFKYHDLDYLLVFANNPKSIFLAEKFLDHHGHEFKNHTFIKG